MLLLADQSLIERIGASPTGDHRNALLLLQSGGLWVRHGSGAPEQPLASQLSALLEQRPAINRAVFFWNLPDEGLRDALGVLAKQGHDFDVQAAVLLGAPSWHSQDCQRVLEVEAQPGNRLVHSVAFTGCQDTSGERVEDDRRSTGLRRVLEALAQADDGLLDSMGLFSSNLDQPPFCAFGIESHARKPEEIPALVTSYTRQLLAEAFHQEAAATGINDQHFPSLVNGFLERLATLHLPRKLQADGHQGAESWHESLPVVENLFDGWQCPWLKKSAIASGGKVLRDQRNAVEKVHKDMVHGLAETASKIRESAGLLRDQAMRDIHDLIRRHNSLGGLAHLLRSFFPVFASLRRERLEKALKDKSPCIPAESPSLLELHQQLVIEGRETLDRVCGTLPTMIQAVAGVVALAGGLGLGVYLSEKPVSPWLTWSAAGAAVLANVVLWTMAWMRRRQAMRVMQDHCSEVSKRLRDSFVHKIQWLLGKTQINLEARVLSEVMGIGRRLDMNLNTLLEEWDRNLDAQNPSEDVTRSLAAAGLTQEAIAELAASIRQISSEVGEASLVQGEWEGQERIRALFADAVCSGVRSVMRSVVPQDGQDDWLMNMARQRREPPILARLSDAHLQQFTVKCFGLPQSYDRQLEERLRQPLYQQSSVFGSVWFGEISGPFVWHARRFLTSGEADFALTAAEVKA